jgi:hypothetical protein
VYPEYREVSTLNQPADRENTRTREDFLFVWGFDQFTGQILPGEMQLFVYSTAPLRTIGYIVNDASVGDVNLWMVFAIVNPKLLDGEEALRPGRLV